METTWLWLLSIGGGIIFLSNVVYAVNKIVRFILHGKQNAESYFEKRVQKIATEIYTELFKRDCERREREFELMKELLATELKPMKEDLTNIKDLQTKTQAAVVSNLKLKLRDLYNMSFKRKGLFTSLEKSNWDEYYSEYFTLGGNGDVKIMNEQIQKIHLEAAYAKQKAKADKTQNEDGLK